MRERLIAEACERLAKRMGCVFVKNDRWPEMFASEAKATTCKNLETEQDR